jgi:excisionase family DNA binding protein
VVGSYTLIRLSCLADSGEQNVAVPALDDEPLVVDDHTAPAMRELHDLLASGDMQPLRIVTATGEAMEVPIPVRRALRKVIAAFAAGDAVTVLPLRQQLSTTQAARLLDVSRPTLIRLLERGEIAYSLVGTHRRLRLADVLAFRARRPATASAHLDAILSEAQESGGYF